MLGINFSSFAISFVGFDLYFKFSFRQSIPTVTHIVFVEEFHKLIAIDFNLGRTLLYFLPFARSRT